ncbi:hypothetical protein SOCEGT47_069150 [Sorangium cellulosum]|uniref:Tat pathway signal protein n=1 Tax=Sorangium cellulosum TaxID=56 RepID=A0A4P2Q9Q5_SORCE|nr:DUF1501 domain-containing protein [Sorangium cellulosum]AUX26354.1 hypothetical protein SOCEGT47_069150 [Sorangium cellulosum]
MAAHRVPDLPRRALLRAAAGAALSGAVALPARALAGEARAVEDEFFLFIHAAGGWDVTLWADPRNERKGLIEPATTDNTDTAPLRRWVDAPGSGAARSFTPVRPRGSNLVFGPAIGRLADLYDRLCIVNGLAMNTVSHPDGTAFATTGRHLGGGRAMSSSLDAICASELGAGQTFPVVSVQYPSAFVGGRLDRRAAPLMVADIGTISRALTRARLYDTDDDRAAVTALLSEEARTLAARAGRSEALDGFSLQAEGLGKMLRSGLHEVFSRGRLVRAHPELDYAARFAGPAAVNAAFALEAIQRNVVRCVSFSSSGFDTHTANYRQHAATQQELFDLIAALLGALDKAPHPTRAGKKLSDHTHILVTSDFCRAPQLNTAMGRDHYPNNSAMVISPRFRGDLAFGRTDPEQLLPAPAKTFQDGPRPIAPPDLLATFLFAFGIPPREHLRDGEVVPELLRGP